MKSETRISELISKLAASCDNNFREEVEAKFAESVFGVLVNGLSNAAHGTKLVIDNSGSVTMQCVQDPNGRKMVKACADPEIFNSNCPGCINATMTGEELLKMAEKMPDVQGILVCSALSSHSFPIYRPAYKKITRETPAKSARKWWEFYKPAQ